MHHSSIEYYSQQLDSVPNGLPRCMRATLAATMLCKQTFNLLGSSLFCQIFAKLSPLLDWLLMKYSCFLHLLLLLLNVTVVTQQLHYLSLQDRNTDHLLAPGKIYRKFLVIMQAYFFSQMDLISKTNRNITQLNMQ